MITIWNALTRAFKNNKVTGKQVAKLKEAQVRTSNITNSKITVNGQVIVDNRTEIDNGNIKVTVSSKSTKSKVQIPKGWFVSEAGQNPLHMLWFVVLVNFDDVTNSIKEPRYFMAEEKDSFEEALQDCIDQINN